MRYNINASLIYDAADGSISLPGSNAPDTQLSITASALLLFFLQHQEVVSREEVLKKVWDDNGLTSSNSNLNQYLSMLRKTFRHYDIENIILTISRGNLQFNPDIAVEMLDSLSPQPAPEVHSEQTTPPKMVEEHQAFPAARKINWNIASAVLLVLSLLMLPFSLINRLHPVFISPVSVSGQGCELSGTTDMVGSVTTHDYEKNFLNVLHELNLTCKPGQRYIFFYSDKLQTKGLGRVFLAHCAIHGNIPFGYCDNYFYYSWEPK
ncbi:helix-turn-helix domain-containing protein [Erwinia sp. S43]|uniref:winged helix-turn-helix domain-containing protein n=1 Tax=unclassified Erwinia TaxID=2622719 RepID=UPI00190ACAE2|nr:MULTISPECIES: helix-turn-helix domain-containing protein [unclassified Erwinia]MBK0032509.1 helix-turn-helix domain-containing protein [Erwinia sp. S43]MCW1873568.1 helix-turn-helix domain-containing protein [Erwinia sp. INIA01]